MLEVKRAHCTAHINSTPSSAMLFWFSWSFPNGLQNLPAGLQPPRLGTLQRQVDRYWAAVQGCCSDLDRYQVGHGRRSQALHVEMI